MVYCGNCGSEIEEGASFCSICGAAAEQVPDADQSNTAPQKSSWFRRLIGRTGWRIPALIGGAVVVLIVVGVIVAVSLGSGDGSVKAPAIAGVTTTSDVSTTTSTADTTTTTSPADAAAGTTLYEITSWSADLSGWLVGSQYKVVNGMLVTDGSDSSMAVASFDPMRADYAVEAEVQAVSSAKFGIVARINGDANYSAGFDGSQVVIKYGEDELQSVSFSLDGGWHKYRLEVKGSSIRFLLDGAEVARADDNKLTDSGTAGIWCGEGSQINIKSFRIIAM